MKTCILHIGVHKTGTTAIQDCLFEGREFLAGKRIGYFDVAANHSIALCLLMQGALSKHWNSRRLRNKSKLSKRQFISGLEQKLVAFFRTDYDVHILSGEDMSSFDSADVSRLRDFLLPFFEQIIVILYVRHPFSYVSSAVQQLVKEGRRLSKLTARLPVENIRKPLKCYRTVFGAEQVRLTAYEDAIRHPLGIPGHFLDQFLDPSETREILAALPAGRPNESLSTMGVLLLDLLNGYISSNDRQLDAQAISALRELCQAAPGDKFRLNMSLAEEYSNRIREEVSWLASFTGGKIAYDLSDPAAYFDQNPPMSDYSELFDRLVDEQMLLSDQRAMLAFRKAMSGCIFGLFATKAVRENIASAINAIHSPSDILEAMESLKGWPFRDLRRLAEKRRAALGASEWTV